MSHYQNLISSNLCNLNWIRQSIKPKNLPKINKSFSVVDLFCGCGGMTLGIWEALRKKGFVLDIKLALDNNKSALTVYQRNFELNDTLISNKNINELVSCYIGEKLNTNEIILQNKYSNLDILVAGPPCQGHSNLNNHTRRNDPRNNLYLNVIRFIEIVSTVIHDKNKVIEKSKYFLNELGYHVESQIINVAEFGLPQTRKRHIQVAVLNNDFNFLSLSSSDYIDDLIDEHKSKTGIFFTPSITKNQERIDYLFKHNLYNLPDAVRPNCHKNKIHSYKSCYGRLYWDRPAQTITSGFGSMGQGRLYPSFTKKSNYTT